MQFHPKSNCCAPSTKRIEGTAVDIPKAKFPQHDEDAVAIPGGKALLGTASPVIKDDGEGPLRNKRVTPFRIAATAVTNAQFSDFVKKTGYITEAEQFGWSFVFNGQVASTVGDTEGVVALEWWRRVDGAYWRNVDGSGDDCLMHLADHPVVHVSWNDACAYANWVGGRLPSEVEWEHAARGGLGDVLFPWGDREPDDKEYFPCNIWQGQFPHRNYGLDGYLATAPVRSFEPNGYGLFNMAGNVWEWTGELFKVRSLRQSARKRYKENIGFRLLKGGSFLCHKTTCYRYRIAARSGNSPDTATSHQGFRVVWDE